jgi:hypothetical protein
VTPEQGPELTRIEMRIDRQLERDELMGFEATGTTPAPEPPEAESTAPAEKDSSTAPKSSPPMLSRRGRTPKRYRRAL